MHTVFKHWETPQEQNLCCGCHVNSGGIPSDWHPECMKSVIKRTHENPVLERNQPEK